ncbi:MAG: M20/M25/M40 family metallo-hydrolase, partial [Cyclobacteriaceae bacterium]
INSGTMNFAGVKKVGFVLKDEFDKLGMNTTWIDGSSFNRSGHLLAETTKGKGKKILLIGHLDTVFEPDSPNQEWIAVDDNTVKGPGIADMKGGDVIILQALKVLHKHGLLNKMNIKVIMTGDEEYSGSPLSLSKNELIKAAEWADIALGFENGDGNPSTVNVARRSSVSWQLKVTGNAAHSSQIFKPEVGAGAIFEASRILNQFYQQLSAEEFLTFNPGFFLGGTDVSLFEGGDSGKAFGKKNVVSKEVTVSGDLRCLTVDQESNAMKTMREIVTENLPGTSASIDFKEGYPPFSPTEGNYQLMKTFSGISQELGFGEVTAVNPSDAGAADISFTNGLIEMGIDGLGMAGKYDHTINEIGYLDALPMQTKRTVILLHRLSK